MFPPKPFDRVFVNVMEGDDRLWIAAGLCRFEVQDPGPVGRTARKTDPAAPMQDSSRLASLLDTAEEEEAEPGGTDGAGPAPRRGRPEGGEVREMRFPCLQTRANPWFWQERPYQGRCHRTCSSVRKAILEAKKG